LLVLLRSCVLVVSYEGLAAAATAAARMASALACPAARHGDTKEVSGPAATEPPFPAFIPPEPLLLLLLSEPSRVSTTSATAPKATRAALKRELSAAAAAAAPSSLGRSQLAAACKEARKSSR